MTDFLHFVRSRQDMLFQWMLNIFLAVVIYLNAEGSRLMGLDHGPLWISPIWPAAGVSLAALLLFGLRTWPGIFLGNFCYNLIHFLTGADDSISAGFAALSVTLGSLIQALVGAFVIHRYSFKGYFKSVKDVIVFLIGGGVVTCLIASSIGVVTLYLYGTLKPEMVMVTWLTFWLGDSLGIYMLTPFLIVWSIYKPIGRLAGQSWKETLGMWATFFAITWISFLEPYPVGDLFILLGLWVAYRASLHAVTLWIIFMSFASTIPTSLGYGSVTAYFSMYPWLALVIFIEILIATMLVVSAIIYELRTSLFLVESQKMSLQQDVRAYKKLFKDLGIKTAGLLRRKSED